MRKLDQTRDEDERQEVGVAASDVELHLAQVADHQHPHHLPGLLRTAKHLPDLLPPRHRSSVLLGNSPDIKTCRGEKNSSRSSNTLDG